MHSRLAQITNPALGDLAEAQGRGEDFFSELTGLLVNIGLIVGSLVFVFTLILGGIQWVSSGGDKAAAEQARGRVINAAIGLIVLFSIFAILTLIETLFGVDLVSIDLGPLQL